MLIRHICLLCHEFTHNLYDLCSHCQKNLPINITLNHTNFSYPIISPFNYSFPISHFITQLKFNYKLIYAKLLGQLLSQHIKQIYQTTSLPQLIIPIPLHKKRLQTRGFNQALEIAKFISKDLNIKINKSSCIRQKNTAPQSELNSTDRRKNIKNSFKIIQPISAKYIALIDDVITTGETSRELADQLMLSGADKIHLWTCARTTLIN